MKPRTTLVLVVLAVLVGLAAWRFGGNAGEETRTAAGTLAFPGLESKLASASRVDIASKGATLILTRGPKGWGLADRGGYLVQQDKLRELLTGLTEVRLTEPRTSDLAEFARLGVDDPKSLTGTATEVSLRDDKGTVLAQLIVGHRRVRPQANVPDTVYVRRPGENQAWLAEGSLPDEVDPQMWIDRAIANIPAEQVAGVEVERGGEHLVFARTDGKAAMVAPAEHPALDQYSVDAMFRPLENLTLEDVRPADQRPGEKLGTTRLTLTDGSAITLTVYGYTNPQAKPDTPPEVWVTFDVAGGTPQARALAEHTAGWAYQLGGWMEKSLVPLMGALKAEEKTPAPAAAPARP